MRVNVVKRKESGQYRVKVTAKDETGRWTTRWVKGGFHTEQQALAKKAEIEATAYHGQITTLDRTTVAGYLDEWLELREATSTIESSTAWSYRNILKRVSKHIGHLPLATLTSQDVQKAYLRIVAEKGASAAKHAHVVFQRAIRDALRDGRILSDPLLRVQAPQAKQHTKLTTLDAAQSAHLIAATAGTETGRIIHLLLATGMRIGEVAALQWGDLDFAKSKIKVQRSMARIRGGGVYLKAPKTVSGRRTISVPPEVMALFAPFKGKTTDSVFKGQKVAALGSKVRIAMAKAGLSEFSTHDLRHAHATFLLKHASNPKTVSKRLGHSDVKITLGIYAHVLDGDDEELGAIAAGLLPPASTTPDTSTETVINGGRKDGSGPEEDQIAGPEKI